MTKKIADIEPCTLEEIAEMDTVTPEELAAVLRVHPNVVRRQCVNGELPAVKVGRKWHIGTKRLLHAILPKKEPRRVIVRRRTA